MINDISSINRIMSIIEDLKIIDSTSNEDNVHKEYLKNYFLPVLDDASEIIEFCISLDLLKRSDSRLFLTNSGNEFLNLNSQKPYRRYELNLAQKEYLLNKIISSEQYSKKINLLLKRFLLNEENKLSARKIQEDFKQEFILNVLEKLSFLDCLGENLIIKERYENEVIGFQMNSRNLPLHKFLEIKFEESIRSNIAEQYVLEYEKKRLLDKGSKQNSKKVDLVSIQNVNAGYDIASYDGPESIEIDRFIEVKSSQSQKIHFFISKNELKKAKKENSNYWIYYVRMEGRNPIKLCMFRNPIETIIKNDKEYNIEYSNLEVTQR